MLRAVEKSGPEGARPCDFAKHYFPVADAPRVKVSGRLLAYMVVEGYVMRVGSRGKWNGGTALHQLTDQGRNFIAGFWKRAQQPQSELADRVPQHQAPSSGAYGAIGELRAPAPPKGPGGYGEIA